ncbi:MAG: PAS domain S-box protein [Gammaproteobacteria bacterium]
MEQVHNTRAQLEEELTLLRQRLAHLEHMSTRLHEAEDEFTRFFTQSLDLLCIAGSDGYFKRVNPAWTSTLGWTREEMQAVPFLDFVHPDDRRATQAELASLRESTDTVLFENRCRHKDGSYRWFQWNARPLHGRQDVYATVLNITTQKRLEREILEVVDQERERLGQELHDGLGQTLAGIAGLSFALSRKLAADSDPAATAAAEITRLLNEAIGQTGDLARGLSTVGLGEAGLEAALEKLALTVEAQVSVSCAFECPARFPRHSPGVEAHLYRIAQEALRNAITHGRANGIEISLSLEGGKGVLSVRDDGVGLPAGHPERWGIGLHTMAYRSHLIGASLEVKPRAGRGTEVSCVFPLPDPHEDEGHAGETS